jgi:hypothetical protein
MDPASEPGAKIMQTTTTHLPRHIRSVLPLAALLCLIAGGTVAATPSMTPDMPPEIRSWRDQILSVDEYVELSNQWRAYLDRHPASAVAHVQLARALRYAQTASGDELNQLIRSAYELDPDCPEALDAVADTGLHSSTSIAPTLEEAYRLGQRAIELAPEWPTPHFNLWSLAVVLGREDDARAHVRAMFEKGGFSSPLIDFAHNLLASTDRDAIIFTNGDNDTYPTLAAQIVHGARTDVLIVNLSLLNREEYALAVWDGLGDQVRPLTADELRKAHRKPLKAPDELPAVRILRQISASVADGSWKLPVYFAVTVPTATLDHCDRELELEGLLWRVTRTAKTAEEGQPLIDADKTLRLLKHDFRLDSATDLAFDWSDHNAVARLMQNYPAVLRLLATAAAEQGDLEQVRYALSEAIRILDFHGRRDMVQRIAEYWKQLDPQNDTMDPWL